MARFTFPVLLGCRRSGKVIVHETEEGTAESWDWEVPGLLPSWRGRCKHQVSPGFSKSKEATVIAELPLLSPKMQGLIFWYS